MPKTLKTTKRSLLSKLAACGPISMRLSKQVECKNWRVRQLVDCDLRADQHGNLVNHYLIDWDISEHGLECDLSWEPDYNISQDLKNEFHRLREENYMIMNGPPIDQPVRKMPSRRCKPVTALVASVEPVGLPSLSPVVPIAPVELASLHQSVGHVPPPVSVASRTMVPSATSFRSTAIFPSALVDNCSTIDPCMEFLSLIPLAKKKPAKRRLVFSSLQDNSKNADLIAGMDHSQINLQHLDNKMEAIGEPSIPLLLLPPPSKDSALPNHDSKTIVPSGTSTKNCAILEELELREKQCSRYNSDRQSPDGYQSDLTEDDEYVPQNNVWKTLDKYVLDSSNGNIPDTADSMEINFDIQQRMRNSNAVIGGIWTAQNCSYEDLCAIYCQKQDNE